MTLEKAELLLEQMMLTGRRMYLVARDGKPLIVDQAAPEDRIIASLENEAMIPSPVEVHVASTAY